MWRMLARDACLSATLSFGHYPEFLGITGRVRRQLSNGTYHRRTVIWLFGNFPRCLLDLKRFFSPGSLCLDLGLYCGIVVMHS